MRFDIELRTRKPSLQLAIGGKTHFVKELPAADGEFALVIDGETVTGHRWSDAERIWVRVRGRTFVVDRRAADATTKKKDGAAIEVRSDMPGTVVAIHTSVGATVASGDPLVTLESMKLQVEVIAEQAGVVSAIHIAANETFERGALLVQISTANAPDEDAVRPTGGPRGSGQSPILKEPT